MYAKSIYQGTTKFIAAFMIVMLALTALPVSPAYAATAGPNFAGAGAEANGPGTIAWSNEGFITADDNNYATANLGNNAVSEYLQATGFGFAIPSNAMINGIQVTIMRQSSSNGGNNSVDDSDLYLLKGGAIVGTDHASGNDWPTTMGTATYGATNDLWGTTWTPAEINAANFGVTLSVLNESGFSSRTASVDYIQVTITYSLPTTTVGDGTSPSSKAVGASSVNNAVSAFTLSTNTGTDTVTDLVVTGGGTGLANVAANGVKIYQSTNSEWDAGDTLVGTASFSGTTATFTGLNITVTTTATNYIITYDIIASPTSGQTMTGAVSGVTATNVVTNNDNTDATLTVGYTITVSAGAGGTIQYPSGTVVTGSIVVAPNATVDIFSVPDAGFVLADVVVNTASVGRANTYRFQNVNANHTLSATFDGGWYRPSALGAGSNWTNTANGYTSNNAWATSNDFPGENANYINFGIPVIPAGSVIDGIEAAYEGWTGNTNANVAVSGDSGSSFAPTSYLTTFIPDVPDRTVILGGPTNTWGKPAWPDPSAWVPSDFTNAEFYMRISSDNYAQLYLDQIQVKVYYREPTDLAVVASPGTNPPNPSASYGSTVDLIATLTTTVGGTPISGRTINFTLNGLPIGNATTDINGVATLSVSLAGITPGTYPTGVGASYAGTLAGTLPGYLGSSVTNSLTIDQVVLTVTADSQTKTYGDPDPVFTFTYSGFLPGDDETGLTTQPTCTVNSIHINVGTYAIDCSGGVDDNYTFVYIPGTLTITGRAITATADPQTKFYGDPDPALTYQITSGSLASGDSFTGGLTRVPGEDIGTYVIQQGTLALNSNYNFTYVGANLTITERAITVTADPQTKSYGTADPALTYQITSGTLLPGDSITGALTRVPGENVGTYAIQQGTLALSGNYTLNYVGANLTITPVSLIITANDDSKLYDQVPYSGGNGVTYSGFVGSDNETNALSGTLTYSGNSQGAVNVGSYDITPGGLTANNGNYAINYINGTLTITPRPITVTAVTDTKAYDGNTSSTGIPTITAGTLASGDTPNFIQTFDTPAIGTGKTLTPSGTVTDGNSGNNYVVTFVPDNTGVISGITVTATGITASNKVYDGTSAAVINTSGAALVGVIPGDDVQLNVAGATGAFDNKNVGNGKTVTISGLTLTGADAANYGVIPPTTTANITTRPITVTAQTNTKVYDGTTSSAAAPVIDVGTLATGDTSNFTQAYSTPTVGTSKLLVPGGEVNDGNGGGNYLVTFVNNTTGVITAQPITITADPKFKAFGDPDPPLTYSITSGSLVGGESLSGNLTRVAGEAVGTYAILQGSLSAGPNYNLTYVGANLTISIVNQTITVITSAPADAAYNTSFNVAATASSGLPVAITTTGACTGSGTTNATIIMASGTGACTVHYNQAGNANFTPALEVLETTAAQRADQTITVSTSAPATAAYNTGFNVAATASSGLPVTYSSSGVCTNAGANFTMTSGTGTCTVQYDQVGNANYNPAPQVTQTVNAQRASQTISVTTSAPSSAAYGSSFTVAATASSGLPVTYSASGACTNSGAVFTMTGSTGTCSVQYNQAGNADFNAAPQVTQTVNAQRANQTITVTTSAPSSAANGASFNVAATASSGLPVSITTSGFCSGSGTGSATITMTSGTGACTVLYNQAGNGTYNAAPQVSETVNSQKSDQTITVTQSAPGTALNGSSFNVAATASSGLPVSITTSGVCTGGGAGSANVTMTSGTGTCTVEYNQAGNANFNPAPSVTETVAAQKVDQTITVTKSAPSTASVNSYFTVAATASSGLPVIYSASGVCTNVGDTFTMTSSIGICTVQYNQPGNTNYNAAPQITQDVLANEGPAITSPNSIDFNVGFPGVFTITTTGNPTPTITQTGTLPAGVSFADNGDGTAILSGLPASGSGGVYDLVITASNGILPNAIQNFTLNVSRGPTVTTNGLDTLPGTGDGHLDEGEVVTVGITQFLVNFSKDVNDPAGNTDPDDATNPANYLLLGNNGDGIQTNSCASGIAGNDTVISVNSINYNNNGGVGPFRATLNINNGQPLTDGNYRLIICGTTSIVDLAGIPLAGNGTLEGTDFVRNFVILISTGGGGGGGGGGAGGGGGGGGASGGTTVSTTLIPMTGFAPGRITDLSGLPVTRYKALGGATLEIPALDIKLRIVGVPKKDNTWDVNWLLNNAGWLEGSAFPGYSGNSVLTSHVTLQYGQPGPFANLHKLKAGDKILVHAFGSLYVFEVRSVDRLSPSNPSIMKHEEKPWLTLFTCADFYDKGSTYLRRLVVKAVLVDTQAEPYQSPGR